MEYYIARDVINHALDEEIFFVCILTFPSDEGRKFYMRSSGLLQMKGIFCTDDYDFIMPDK